MIDWDAVVLSKVHAVFEEVVTYFPKDGVSYSTVGVFDKEYLQIKAGLENMSARPLLGVRRADLQADPQQGDIFIVVRLGERYVVREIEPDSHGEIKLLANRLNT
jgi:hypothetical protein